MVIPKRKKKEKLVEKTCAFPDCKKIFFGTGASRYCEKHRSRKYRKIIDKTVVKKRKIVDTLDTNQTIEHSYNEVQRIQFECALDGCTNQFEVKVFPKIFVYPKYCNEHRNPYKRERFLKCIS